ncbi:hypothetical protein BD324DRAFT_636032 [Kockovaella imperatae]|uniref:N-acetyltransferase domain-containing protein n=1 Tax=Kockovaella imperatae TaxID=4999 RepID=A0A1Y1UA90_9TREE|nr:hypothetical protein BD324DRAFT_636032 [Kockovaella imperatae]ORX34464.1 hypothetical protein BD324DRAFT_636032 [Kockovaella imperatae]
MVNDLPLTGHLEANHIPVEPFSSLPRLRISPHGLPYIQLPAPCEEYCLTNYLATPEGVQHDAETEAQILRDTPVSKTLATFLSGGTVTVDSVKQSIEKYQQERIGWCMPVIRLTAEAQADPMPALLGVTLLKRATHAEGGKQYRQIRQREDEGKSDREVGWSISCWLHPAHQGKGITTAAYRYCIKEWFLPYIYTYPGQLRSGFLAVNTASEAFQKKLGFKTVAKSYWLVETRMNNGLEVGDDKEKWKSGCGLWQGFNGEYPIRKEDSDYRHFDDWD